jgi:hypothetical protein
MPGTPTCPGFRTRQYAVASPLASRDWSSNTAARHEGIPNSFGRSDWQLPPLRFNRWQRSESAYGVETKLGFGAWVLKKCLCLGVLEGYLEWPTQT